MPETRGCVVLPCDSTLAQGGVENAVFAGTALLCTSAGKEVQVWDVGPSKRRLASLTDHTSTVSAVARSPFLSGIVGSCSRDTTIRLWNLETRPISCYATLVGPCVMWTCEPRVSRQGVFAARTRVILQVPPGSFWLFAARRKRVPSDGRGTNESQTTRVRGRPTGHTASVTSIAFAEQIPRLISGSTDGTVRRVGAGRWCWAG